MYRPIVYLTKQAFGSLVLIDFYFLVNFRKAILFMGIILLNVCLAALFYDPVEKHLKKRLVPRKPTSEIKAEVVRSTSNGFLRNAATDGIVIGSNVSVILGYLC